MPTFYAHRQVIPPCRTPDWPEPWTKCRASWVPSVATGLSTGLIQSEGACALWIRGHRLLSRPPVRSMVCPS